MGRSRAGVARQQEATSRVLGLCTAIKPLLRRSTTGEFESPPNYSRKLKKAPPGRREDWQRSSLATAGRVANNGLMEWPIMD
eukprot:1013995-Pyramimonas_sp.AAC.2